MGRLLEQGWTTSRQQIFPLRERERSQRGVGHERELPADTRRGSTSAAGKELQVYTYFRAMLYTRQAMELSKASKTLL